MELADRAEREARAHESTLADAMRFVDTTITDERKRSEALERAQEMRVKQDAENTALGRTFAQDTDKANAFSKLSRYETSIEWGLYKALHELQRLQAARAPRAAFRRLWQWTSTSPAPLSATAQVWLCFAKNGT